MNRSFLISFNTDPGNKISYPGINRKIIVRKRNACILIAIIIITGLMVLAGFLVAGIMYPRLTVPSEMSPFFNSTVLVVMIILASVSGLSWIVIYLKRNIDPEQSEKIKTMKLDESGTRRLISTTDTFRTELKDDVDHHDLFIQKVHALLDRNIEDHQFGIPQLCTAMGISRAQMYRKFKALTGRTLHDYLRSYRLKRAKELLLTTDLNVSEAAYTTGFTNVSHFSRIFTEEFGKHPRDYRKITYSFPLR
ncbi:MAG: helix-turn-helix transcriptional regulator [Bacteroidales bacterium]|nr:helix-turn-helix transcriptional regulator [Bacteroidales bacterium]